MVNLKDIKVNVNVDTTDFIKSLRQLQESIKMSDRPSTKQRERVHEIVDSILDSYHPKVKIVTKASKKIMTIEADINDYEVEK
ncbi:hypothetical protein CPEBRM1_ABPJDJAI_01110 [Companilactobacillus paralimentarius]|uniref:hypothetical protein n=1 Tax=Companilactobacillus paralimentarius TaxID=83526 RepID=UPI00384AF660